jgi:hypothetical protein
MTVVRKMHGYSSTAIAHMDELLDEALNETFPASDPVAINIERTSDQRVAASWRGSRAPLADGQDED